MITSKKSHPHPRNRGTVLVMALLVSVILTSLVLTIAWSTGIQSQVTASTVDMDQGFFVAEAGAQRALWQWKNAGYTWNSTGSWTMTIYDQTTGAAVRSWTQNYSCAPDANHSGCYLISCTATDGTTFNSDSPTNLVSFDATSPSASTPPPGILAGGNNGNISGTVKITGDFATQGALNSSNITVTGNLTVGGAMNGSPTVGGNTLVNGDNNGSGHYTGNLSVNGSNNSSPTVGGNLTYANSCWGSPTVGGSKIHAAVSVTVPTPPSVSTMFTTLQSSAGYTMVSPSTVTTLDFTQAANGIIYISGSANISSTVTIKGTGTVVVNGDWNQSGTFPPSGTATCNIVVKGNLNCSGKLNVTGGVYATGDWNQSGSFAVTGGVTVGGNYNVSGSGTIAAATPPAFDPRATGGSGSGSGSSTIALTNFSGLTP